MNKDQVKGKLKGAVGNVQELAGKITGNTGQQLKGIKKQAEGQAQETAGDIKEVVKDVARK